MSTLAKLVSVAALLALAAVPAAAQNGSLKVSSFPSGAAVIVDGVSTGKITPMSVSLSVGDHSVTVTIPNSGWNPDTRVVPVASGNNDLSVTLLPKLTTGPQGPEGPKGDKGDPGATGATGAAGAAGPPATVRAASSNECATGGIVVTSGDGSVSLPVCNGAQGAQGIAGPAGAQGPAGAAGTGGGEVDPTTRVSFGPNLRIAIDGNQVDDLGLSPIYILAGVIEFRNGAGHTTKIPGQPELQPFSLAAAGSNEIAVLRDWFDGAAADPQHNRHSVRVRLVDTTASGDPAALDFTLADCLPTGFASAFGVNPARLVVGCHHVAQLHVPGSNRPFSSPGGAALVPVGQFSFPLFLESEGPSQLASNLSGGGVHLLQGDQTIDPVHVRVGTRNGNGNQTTFLEQWIKGLLDGSPDAKRDYLIGVAASSGAQVQASFGEAFFSYVGLIDPNQIVDSTGDIRAGFDLVIEANELN
jgi:hypothetical protein